MINKELQKRILSSIILLPLAYYFISAGSFYLIFFSIICFFVSIYEWNKMVKKIEFKVFGTLFLIFSFYTFYETTSTDLWILVLLVCVSTDIGGYIFGKIIGGKKLTKISPNKTISGTMGSFLLSIVPLFLFLNLDNIDIEFNPKDVLFVLLVSLISQLGDLFISFLKRKAKIKDTGKILPGHGGVLDRIDGIIFAVPFSYFLLKLL